MLNKYYVLEGKTVKEVATVEEWGRMFEDRGRRRVGKTDIEGVRVSTVFLGINHSFGHGPPLLFETMIFGGPHDEYQDRYSTYKEAEAGHEKAVALVIGRAIQKQRVIDETLD